MHLPLAVCLLFLGRQLIVGVDPRMRIRGRYHAANRGQNELVGIQRIRMVHAQLIEHLGEQLQVLVHGALPDDARGVLRRQRGRERRENACDGESSAHCYFPPTDESAVRRAWAKGLNSWFCAASAMNLLYQSTASAVLPSPS